MSLIILKIIDGHSLTTFRQLEKLWVKKTRILCHLDFNITCYIRIEELKNLISKFKFNQQLYKGPVA